MRNLSADRLFTISAAAMAVVSAGFGVSMIVRLERMEDPPAVMGLDFSMLEKIEGVPQLAADPIQTGSITAVPNNRQPGGAATVRRTQVSGVQFRLLSVIDGVAFVEVSGPAGKELWPVNEGAVLPGAGQVTRISRSGERWTVTTPMMTIGGEAQ